MKRQPINKDNYEEYFLLYVDNELNDTEKAEVEKFIELNPGLKIELQMFLDTRLQLEEVKMDGIEDLYKFEEGLINQGNYEELQVLMIDNELDRERREALEKFQAQHPEAAANFEWLKKTKLPEENIVFPDKGSLYRTEKKPASIISITWIRYAAAAAVILMAALFWISNGNDLTSDAPQVAVEVPGSEGKGETGRKIESKIDSERKNLTDNSIPIAAVAGDEANRSASKEKNINSSTAVKFVPENDNTVKPGNGRMEANENKPVKEALASVEPPKIAAAVEKNETRISTDDLVAKTAGTFNQASPVAQPAVAMNVKTNYASEALNGVLDSEDDEAVPVEEGKQKRGLRGIVRKANRIYNKVTNPDLDRQLVKVANFEIGLR